MRRGADGALDAREPGAAARRREKTLSSESIGVPCAIGAKAAQRRSPPARDPHGPSGCRRCELGNAASSAAQLAHQRVVLGVGDRRPADGIASLVGGDERAQLVDARRCVRLAAGVRFVGSAAHNGSLAPCRHHAGAPRATRYNGRMATYVADPTHTLARARDDYFRVNEFGADGGYSSDWVDFKLGPIPMPFPNTPSRKRAVRYHDLHHALTGYATDLVGEFEISAWEIGSGCADHVAAWQLNLGGMVGGLLGAPRRTVAAFVRGRRSRNLYRAAYDDALLGRTVGEMRRELGLEAPPAHAGAADLFWLGLAAVAGLIIGLFFLALLIPVAVIANVAALFRRR